MHRATFALTLLLAIGLPGAGAQGQGSSTVGSGLLSDAVPLYRVSFQRQQEVPGINASRAIELPFGCTSDGTIFITFVGALSAKGLPPPAPVPPPTQLVSVSPAGRGVVFRLDQVPDLYISREVDHYASDSDVVFLVKASREYKPVKQLYSMKDGSHGEFIENAAQQHLYILNFNRNGEYRQTIDIEDAFSIQHLGVFPSGTFLAFGFDEKDHTAKLAMLKNDGTLLEYLQIPKGDVPESMLGGADAPHPFTLVQSEFVPEGHSILVVQNKTNFPLLEVGEGGMVRAIRPKLPKGEQIDAVIPADRNLYVIANQETAARASDGVIYELSLEDGAVVGRFALIERTAPDVSCVYDGKFLSVDYQDSKVVPLIGSAEPAATGDQQKR